MNDLAKASNVVPLNPADISGAAHDDQLVAMWLSGRPKNTRRSYKTGIKRFRAHIVKPIRSMTASDLIGYAESLGNLAMTSQHLRLSAVKSLFSYAHKLGYISLDPAVALRMPKPQSDRASKIRTREIVLSVIASASPGRDRLICQTLYLCGLRESELIGLNAGDVHSFGESASLAIRGKGEKTRHIAIPSEFADELVAHAGSPLGDSPVFRSVNKKRLSASDIYRIVRTAGKSVGVKIAPHLLRHAHASHSLDAGAPIHVLRETLGHSSINTTSVYIHSRPTDSSAFYICRNADTDNPQES